MDTTWKTIIAVYVVFVGLLGFLFVSKFYFKPNPVVIGVQYEVEQSGSGARQVFTGEVKNVGQKAAYDVRIFVTWVTMGGASYTDSMYLGCIEPGSKSPFCIVFEVGDEFLVKYHSHKVEFSSN